MTYFREMFCDESGKPSLTRSLGTIVMACGIVLAFLESSATATVLTTGAALLGVGQIKSAVVSSAATATAKGDTATATATPEKKIAPED